MEANIHSKILYKLNETDIALWQQLWDSSQFNHFFNSPKFFLSCCRVFSFKKMAVIFCFQDDELRAVLPLVLVRIFGVKTFAPIGKKENYIDRCPLLSDRLSQDIFKSVLRKALELGNVNLSELSEKEMEMFIREKPSFVKEVSICRYLLLNQGSDILQFMPPRQCSSLSKRIRKMQNRFELKIEDYNSFDKVINTEKESNREKRGIAFFKNKTATSFLKSIIEHWGSSLMIGVLYLDNKVVATNMGFVCGKNFFGYHMSFKKEYKNLALGKVTFYMMLKYLRDKGFEKADFLRGDSRMKKDFAKDSRKQYDMYFARNKFISAWWNVSLSSFFLLKKLKQAEAKAKVVATEIAIKFFYCCRNIGKQLKNFFYRKKPKKIKKKIIFSNFDDVENPWYGGGGAYSISRVAKGLIKEFEVTVITGRYPGSKNERKEGVSYIRIGISAFGPKIGQLIFSFLIPFYAAIKKHDIWIESFSPPFGPMLVPLVTNKPVVALVHMLPGMDMWRKYGLPFFLLERKTLKFYRNFIVLTEEMKTKIQEYVPNAFYSVIPNGIDFPGDFRVTPKKILFLGRIEVDQKGLDLLINSYAKVAKIVPFPLVIAGGGMKEEIKKLEILISKSECKNKISFIGKFDERKREELLKNAAVLVIPSRFETFGIVALEAFSHGVPVVTFDLRNLKWISDLCAVKVKPFDENFLSQAITLLAKDSNLRNNMGSSAIEFSKKFEWKKVISKYANFLNEVIKNE